MYISNTNPKYRIRAVNSLFSNDPYWIAYYKVGGCGELAHLFVEVCNRAGIEARVVGTRGEDHFWAEVKIDGEWKHADPTVYYWSVRGNEQQKSYYSGKWFDNPKGYEESGNIGWFSKIGISRVIVTDRAGNEVEDVTVKYTDVGTVNVTSKATISRVIILTWKGEHQTIAGVIKDVNSNALEIKLGGKNYTLIVEQDTIPWLIVKRDSKNVTVLEGRYINLEFEPQSFAPTDILIFISVVTLSIIGGIVVVSGIRVVYASIKKKERQ